MQFVFFLSTAQYQTVQVAGQPGMMALQDSSQIVQSSIANVQMPLFTQQAGKISELKILFLILLKYVIIFQKKY